MPELMLIKNFLFTKIAFDITLMHIVIFKHLDIIFNKFVANSAINLVELWNWSVYERVLIDCGRNSESLRLRLLFVLHLLKVNLSKWTLVSLK